MIDPGVRTGSADCTGPTLGYLLDVFSLITVAFTVFIFQVANWVSLYDAHTVIYCTETTVIINDFDIN